MSAVLPHLNLRVIVIDDNRSIHEDFARALVVDRRGEQRDEQSEELESELFGGDARDRGVELVSFEVDFAEQGEEGYEKIVAAAGEGRPYALAFVDIRMPPGWDGIETLTHVWEVDPAIEAVICTAYSDHTWERMIKKLRTTDQLLLLKKPFDKMEIRQLATALTRKWTLERMAEGKSLPAGPHLSADAA